MQKLQYKWVSILLLFVICTVGFFPIEPKVNEQSVAVPVKAGFPKASMPSKKIADGTLPKKDKNTKKSDEKKATNVFKLIMASKPVVRTRAFLVNPAALTIKGWQAVIGGTVGVIAVIATITAIVLGRKFKSADRAKTCAEAVARDAETVKNTVMTAAEEQKRKAIALVQAAEAARDAALARVTEVEAATAASEAARDAALARVTEVEAATAASEAARDAALVRVAEVEAVIAAAEKERDNVLARLAVADFARDAAVADVERVAAKKADISIDFASMKVKEAERRRDMALSSVIKAEMALSITLDRAHNAETAAYKLEIARSNDKTILNETASLCVLLDEIVQVCEFRKTCELGHACELCQKYQSYTGSDRFGEGCERKLESFRASVIHVFTMYPSIKETLGREDVDLLLSLRICNLKVADCDAIILSASTLLKKLDLPKSLVNVIVGFMRRARKAEAELSSIRSDCDMLRFELSNAKAREKKAWEEKHGTVLYTTPSEMRVTDPTPAPSTAGRVRADPATSSGMGIY